MTPDPLWGRVVGQPAVVAQLQAAAAAGLAGGDPGHAWLFVGPAGSGRSVAALAFAAALECPAGGDGTCAVCRAVLAGTYPDVLRVSTEGLSLGVRGMRELVPVASSAPSVGRRRVIVIEDADRLTEQAANVLLKPLEEPGPRTTFLLCAPSLADVLPTVRSRCRVAQLRLPSTDAVATVLEAEGVHREKAVFAAAAAQGHVGRARRLARDEQSQARRAAVLALPKELGTVGSALAAAAELVAAADEEAGVETSERDAGETAALREGLGIGVRGVGPRGTAGALRELEAEQKSRATRNRRDVLDRALVDLAAWYRDVLVVQLTAGAAAQPAPVHADQTAAVGRLAGHISPESALRCVEAVLCCRDQIAENVNPLLACERMALALRAG